MATGIAEIIVYQSADQSVHNLCGLSGEISEGHPKKAQRYSYFIHVGNAGTLEHWNTGTLEHWNTGTLEPWNTGTLEPFKHNSHDSM